MHRYFIVFACILLYSSCCKKRACAGDELPRIVVKFSGVLPHDETIILYTLENGKTDSTFIPLDPDNPSFQIFPMNDFDDADLSLRKFLIRHNSMLDTIQHAVAVFRDFEIACDNGWGCGRRGNKGQTIKKLMHFSFLCRGKKHALADTLRLDW